MRLPLVILGSMLMSALAWGLFTRRWSAAARAASALDRASIDARHPLLAVPVPWVYVLAFLVGVGVDLVLPLRVAWSPVMYLGIAPLVLGILLAFSALGIFKRSRTTTVPFGTPSQLIVYGPYRLTRNPMYLGLALAYIGVAITQGRIWPLLALPLVLIYVDRVVIPVEERRLEEKFGDAYNRYRGRVRRWM